MVKPRALVLTGYGINCDRETQFAFKQAGAIAERVHVNELIDGRVKLSGYQILALPGGFSYGDDLGAGVALANRMRTRVGDDVKRFIDDEKIKLALQALKFDESLTVVSKASEYLISKFDLKYSNLEISEIIKTLKQKGYN
ncbi:MAG: phosphoribosylformylglycinamidine synthase subunit PurQ [Bacteroidetes bacterium]|nr:phosphoribosylformylglycinamidine synthase subunit PurQ [Bacteroidota bacterium]